MADPESRGRLVAPGKLRTERGVIDVVIRGGDDVKVGDVVSVDRHGSARLLTPNREADGPRMSWTRQVLDPRRLRAIDIRDRVESGIRDFFRGRGFRETRTPLLVPSPGMEPHIRPVRTDTGAYLPTSPEFAMKRLLAGGLEKIFQICPAFRSEPRSRTHHPEFMMLEWYRAYAGYESIMKDVESLFEHLARSPFIEYQGRRISVAAPWPRLRVRDLFMEHAGVDLVASATRESLAAECKRLQLDTQPEDSWDDLYFRIWLNLIEPQLPADRAVIVTRYPASQAALAVVDTDPDGSRWARRFEVYAGGLELGNAFEELTDPDEQRRRFVADMELRQKQYGDSFPPSPIDEGFLHALREGIPPAAGIAMGVDRIVMLYADEPDLEYTTWLPSFTENPL